MARNLGILLVAISVVSAGLPLSVRAADVIYDCPVTEAGDFIDRGFYVEAFSGLTLSTVTLTYQTSGEAGLYTVALKAREGTFDGPVLGSIEVTFDQTGGLQSFDFLDVPIGSTMTITFEQTLLSAPAGGLVYYKTGPCAIGDADCTSCTGIFETEDTTPPLSTFRRRSVAVTITGRANTPAESDSWGAMKVLYR